MYKKYSRESSANSLKGSFNANIETTNQSEFKIYHKGNMTKEEY